MQSMQSRKALHAASDLRNSSVENRSILKPSLANQSIVILDFGAQYTQLIARRIREQNVFSVVLPCTASLDEVKSYEPIGIVLSGAPWSVYDKDAPPADARVFELDIPVPVSYTHLDVYKRQSPPFLKLLSPTKK